MAPTPVNAAEAVQEIRSRERVFAGGIASTPHHLLAALVARGKELCGVRNAHMILMGEAPHTAPDLADSFATDCLFLGASTWEAVLANRADFVSCCLREMPRRPAVRPPCAGRGAGAAHAA